MRLLDLIGLAAGSAALFVLLRDRFASPREGILAALSYPLLYVPCGHWVTSQCESFHAALWTRLRGILETTADPRVTKPEPRYEKPPYSGPFPQ